MTPLLLLLGLGAAEFSNLMFSYDTVSHVAREGGSIVSREMAQKGSAPWVSAVNANLNTVISVSSPIINLTGTGPTGPNQFKVIYSIIEWNPNTSLPGQGSCVYNAASNDPYIRGLGPNCAGTIAGSSNDYYHIRRNNTGFANNITWTYGNLGVSSALGADLECACKNLKQVKQLSTFGLNLHAVEVFYDYRPSAISGLKNILKMLGTQNYYSRSIFVGAT